jgi:hypothetical protein
MADRLKDGCQAAIQVGTSGRKAGRGDCQAGGKRDRCQGWGGRRGISMRAWKVLLQSQAKDPTAITKLMRQYC